MRGLLASPTASPLPRPLLLLVVVVAVAVYLPSLGNGFAYDDVPMLVEHEELHDLGALPDRLASPYWSNRFGRVLGLWRPVTTTVLAVQWAAWDGSPAGFHLINVLLHAGVTLLVTLLLGRLLPPLGALTGGLVFALHPVHVEAVANVVGVAELLAALFFLGACLLHLRGREREEEGRRDGEVGPPASGGDPPAPAAAYGPGRTAGVAVLYLLAVLSKEGAIVLPAVLLLLDAHAGRLRPLDLPGYLRRRRGLYLALGAAVGAALVGRWAVLGSLADPAAPLGAGALQELPRVWTVFGIWPHYLRLLLLPAELSADYSPLVLPVLHGWTVASVGGLLLGLGLLGGALRLWRRAGPVVAGPPVVALLWFVLTVLPVSNVFFLSGVLLAERTLYLPSLAVALAAGWLVGVLVPVRLITGSRVGPVAGLVLAGLAGWTTWLGVRTVDRIPVWESTETVFLNLIEEHPESGRAQWFWGDILAEGGEEERGLTHLRIAARILGLRDYFFLTSLGRRMMRMDRPDLAELYFRYALNSDAGFPEAHQYLAVIYQNQGRWPEAEREARLTLETGDGNPTMNHLLATALEEQGRWAEAIPHRRIAAEAAPDDWRRWSWLARTEREAGELEAACRSFGEALRRTEDPEVIRVVDSLRADVGSRIPGSECLAN